MRTHVFHVLDPWFDYIRSGEKTTEAFCNKRFHFLPHDTIIFLNEARTESVPRAVRAVIRYDTLQDYFEGEELSTIAPGIDTVEEVIDIYRRVISVDDESAYGVLAIRF